jgi:thiol-disulfide isomerase/thioredoxin
MSRRRLLLTLVATSLLGAAPGPLSLVDPDGAPVRLALEPGEKALVVHFWASWCVECEKELPVLGRAARACRGAPVRVVAVNAGDTAEEVARYRTEHPFELPVLRDPDGDAWRRFARGLPANLFWTSSGQHAEVGPIDEASWSRRLAELGCDAAAP